MQKIDSKQGAFWICNQSETVQRSLMAYGYFEPQSVFWALVANNLKKGLIVDVGANIGVFSIGLAKYEPEINILSIEPQPLVFNHLSANILINRLKNISAIHAAVGGRGIVGPQTIKVPVFDVFEENFTGSVSLSEDVQRVRSEISGIEEPSKRARAYVDVRLLSLDELLSGANPSFLKVDVEGMELQVFKSGSNALQRHRPFLYFEAWTLREFSELRHDLLSFIESLGYNLIIVGEDIFASPDIYPADAILKSFESVLANNRYSDLIGCIGHDGLDLWRNELVKISYSSPALIFSGGVPDRVAPLFSVIITTYNRPKFLLDALSSVVTQEHRSCELIVVNDNGLPVEGCISEFSVPINYIRVSQNGGPGAARNKAIASARGEYLLFLDDDDEFLPNHLEALEGAISANPESIIYTDANFITEKIDGDNRLVLSEESRYQHSEFSFERLLISNYIPINALAIPANLAKKVGGFDESLEGLEDWDFLLRLAARSQFVHIPLTTVLVRMRVADETEERRSERAAKSYAELYQRIYRSSSDLGSEQVRRGRAAQLRGLGVAEKGKSVSVRSWLKGRILTPVQQRFLQDYKDGQKLDAAHLEILIIDLIGDAEALSRTLASMQSVGEVSNISSRVLSVLGKPHDSPEVWIQIQSDNWIATFNEQLAANSSDWILLLRAGDEFNASGLQMVSVELLADPHCRAIYCDALYRQADGDYGAALRPDFNLDYLLSFPRGLVHNWLFSRSHVLDLNGLDEQMGDAFELDLVLRLISQGGINGFAHISEPLVISAAPILNDNLNERDAILRHLRARGYENATLDSVRPGQYVINYAHAEQPLVSIVVVVEDQLAMSQRCMMSVLENTDYAQYEILLIDNGCQDSETKQWLAGVGQVGSDQIRVMSSPERLNYSEACNQAAINANGDYLVLLRSDVAAVGADWLGALMNHGQRPEVGAVGARTVSAEGQVTHAGLILGLQGPAGEIFLGEPLDSPGYMQRLQVDQNLSAVSDGCLLVRKALYLALGGMDAEAFADEGAAIDFCLRVSDSGHLIVWTPKATLLHGSEKKAFSVNTEDTLYERWLPRLARDPAYNQNFSLVKPGGFKLADTQISWRPLDSWRPMPVVLAHPADLFGCGHYRIIQPMNALKEEGYVDGALSVGLMHVTDLERYNPDVVILQRQIGKERLDAMRRMKLLSSAFKVYELDDYLPNLPLKSMHRQQMPKDITKSLRRGLSMVDRFVVSTEPLAEALGDMHRDIRVVKNRLDPRWWSSLPSSDRPESLKPRVGWAGGSSHTGDLELIADVVRDLADEVEWVFFGLCPDKLRPFVQEFHPGVTIEQYPAALARLDLDLALAPVENNFFNECKSNLRLLEYGICGFPVICTDIRCYEGDLPVTRVRNRYKDWVDAIRMHLSDLDAAARLGNELKVKVQRDWMLTGDNLELWRKAWLPD